MPVSFWILVALTLVFTYVNGFHDGCNVVATLIASRSMKPYPALAWAATVEALSPFAILLLGSSVSDTIKKLVAQSFYADPAAKSVALAFICAGILAAILWNLTDMAVRDSRFVFPCAHRRRGRRRVRRLWQPCDRLELLLVENRTHDLRHPRSELSRGFLPSCCCCGF